MTTRRKVSGRLGSAILLLVLLVLPTAAQEALSLEGRPIAQVRIVTEDGQLLAENPADLPVAPGVNYSSDAVRQALRTLFQSGLYADIRVEATLVDAGVRLDIVVRRNYFVNLVRVHGLPEQPGESWAQAALRLGLGEIFREAEMGDALERLREALREEGFYEAELTHTVSPHAETRQMDIDVQVSLGARARIGDIQVHSQSEFSNERLLSKAKLKTGRHVTSARLTSASERLRDFIVDRGYLSARVVVRRGPFHPDNNTVPLILEVFSGPKVRVEVEGAKISKGDLRKLLPIYEEGAVDADLLEEGRRDIRDFLERDGYFDSQVSYTTGEDSKTGEQVIVYQVEHGHRRRLAGISFSGNRYFGSELLRSILRIQPAGFLARGRFRRSLLRDDEEAIRDLYSSNGFREAQVSAEVNEGNPSSEGDLHVRFVIAEGPQTRVGELELEGNAGLSDDYLLGNINSTPGQPFSEANVSGDRANVLALYYNEGFPEATFEARAEEMAEANRFRLVYQIKEGPRVRVSRVLVSGLENTRPGVARREILMQPGEPLREREVVETQRNLYNLGIFSRVAVAPQNPQGSHREKSMVVMVEEAKRYTIAFGGGLEVQRLGGAGDDPVGGAVRFSPRGLFEITKANFGGRAHTLAFKARGSSLQGRALLSYAAPNFLANRDLSLLLTGLADKTRDVRTFSATRYEASSQLVQRVSATTTWLYRYSFRRVLVDAGSLRIPAARIPLFSQPTKISALGLTWVRERRDNPADANRGDFNTLDFSIASGPLGSSASFGRLFFQNSTFHPLNGKLVFARSVRIGLEEPLGDTVETDIPLPERFFAGGGNSLRGFGLNQAGPRDPGSGFPIGGLAMLVFNQELRFPMRLPFVRGTLGGALFYDAGNVFSRTNRITFRPTPASPDDLNYFSHTIGFSFRYGTPIGPVRLDIGYLLNPARFQFCVEDQTVTTPTAPCAAMQRLTTQRLPRLQFFFNIGSIF